MKGTWTKRCPHCGRMGHLIVISAMMVANGKRATPRTPLLSDGFEVDPAGKYSHLKDQSTDEEKVQCDGCGTQFPLEQLTWEWLLPGDPVRVFWQKFSDTILDRDGTYLSISIAPLTDLNGISNFRINPIMAQALYEALRKALSER